MSRLPRPARTAALAVGAVVLLLVALLATREPAADRKNESELIGKQAPGISGEVLLGEPFDIGATDRWVVVNFFASWCVPCVTEHPELVAFAEDHAETGDARVVSVVYSDKAEDVRRFFSERGGSWPVFDSDQGRTALDWGVARVPESYLVAPTGVVVARFVSGVTQAQLDAVIAQYTQQSDGASPSDAEADDVGSGASGADVTVPGDPGSDDPGSDDPGSDDAEPGVSGSDDSVPVDPEAGVIGEEDDSGGMHAGGEAGS